MYCEGCVIIANSHKFKLLNAEENDKKKVNEIRRTLNKMTNYINDYVIIDFYDKISSFDKENSNFIKDTIIFFQTIKRKEYHLLNFYDVEIRIDSKSNSKAYTRLVKKKEMLQLFEEICVQRKFPDLSKWKKYYDLVEDGDFANKDKVMTEEIKQKISDSKDIVNNYWLGELQKTDYPIYLNALKFLYEEGWNSDVTYHEMYFDELDKMLLPSNLLKKFKGTTSPTILCKIGKKYLYGTNGNPPNYKLAYKYFYHGDKLGNVECRFYKGLMYKYGLHVKQNRYKYSDLLTSILKEFLYAGGEEVFPYIDFFLIERAKRFKEYDEYEKTLKFAEMARELNDSRIYNYLSVSNMPEILDIIYSIVPFDKDDMDVYDLLYLLKKPAKAKFFAKGKEYDIESFNNNGYCIVKFNNKYYKNAKEFFNKAVIDGKKFYEYLINVDSVEVL